MVCIGRPYPFNFLKAVFLKIYLSPLLNFYPKYASEYCPVYLKIFKGCFPEILLSPFLNTLSHVHLSPKYSSL